MGQHEPGDGLVSITEYGPTTLYRWFDANGKLLYVGITCDPGARFRTHMDEAQWWAEAVTCRLERYSTRVEALTAELHAIQTEAPTYNLSGRLGRIRAGHAKGRAVMRLGWVNALRRMRQESEVAEQDLADYLEMAKRLGYSEEAGEQAIVLGQSAYDLDSLGKMLAAFGLQDRSELIHAMFKAEVDSKGIIEALQGLPEYRAPFPPLIAAPTPAWEPFRGLSCVPPPESIPAAGRSTPASSGQGNPAAS